jgi:hypothetical protein
MNAKFHVFAVVGMMICCGAASAAATPTEVAVTFLKDLQNGQIDEAMKLWSAKEATPRMREHVTKMAAKIKKFGGIKQIKTPEVEKREKNLAAHEVVVIVIYQSKDLAFGSVSFVEENGQFKILGLRSEQGWGGTTSLFGEDQQASENGGDVPSE